MTNISLAVARLQREYLLKEYDAVEGTGLNEWIAYIEYLEESHFITFYGCQCWAYNPDTNHRWIVGIMEE